MNASRRDFIKIGAVAGATVFANGLEGATGAVAQNADAAASLHVPEGADFAGLAGAYAALITPYKKDGSINEEMIERIVEHGLANGLRGFYLTGSTGEGFLLGADERVRVYERAVKAARGRAKMIAHVGCLSTDDAASLARRAAKAKRASELGSAEVAAQRESLSAHLKAARDAAREAREKEAAERRARTDALREEAAERARRNDSVAGRVKNTAISTATRQIVSNLTKSLTKAISGLLGGKK